MCSQSYRYLHECWRVETLAQTVFSLYRLSVPTRKGIGYSMNICPKCGSPVKRSSRRGFIPWSLVLICRRCICDVAAGTAWATSRTNENMRRRQLEPSQSSTAGMPAKLNSSQLRRHAGGKNWDDQCCQALLFSYRNSIPGSTGAHVAGTTAAYENQA